MTTSRRLFNLLTPPQRRAAITMFGLMLVGMVLETLGVGLVIPALGVMTQADLGQRYPAVAPWLARLGNPSREWLVVGGMLLLVAVSTTRAAYLGWLAFRQSRFTFGINAELSERLFAGYLRLPYAFHLRRNSAQLFNVAINQVGNVVAVLQQILMLVSELLVLAGIAALLLAVEPVGAMVVTITLGAAGWGFNVLTRNHILVWGQKRQHHDALRIQTMQEGLSGVKDIKLLGREQGFLVRYEVHNAGSARVAERQYAFQGLPRLWIELLAVTGLAALVLTMLGRGRPIEDVLPTLGLFAAAAFRVMPSVTRVLAAVQTIRYLKPVVDNVYNEARLIEAVESPSPGDPFAFNEALVIDRVTFRYEGAPAEALRGVSLTVPRGWSVGLIGGSGAGKSTLVDVLLGLLTPDSGAVLADGVDIQTNLRRWQDRIGYVPQSIFLTDDSLRSNVAFGVPADQIDEAAVRSAIRSAQLEQFVANLPDGLDSAVGERGVRLSGGQRQRIGIARALYHNPSLLVLDEATSSLDSATERGVMDAVRALRGDKTIIIVAHRLSTVEHCDRLFKLEQGRLVEEGATADVLARLPVPVAEGNGSRDV